MSATTSIEWTDRTWNPTTGCDKVSPGCAHCYAEGVADRFWATQYPPALLDGRNLNAISTSHHENYLADGLARPRRFTDVWTHKDRLLEPLSWRKPARVFVNSMSDLFHEDVPDAFIDKVFAVMALAPRHTFQILTKRPQRMRDYLLTLTGSVERMDDLVDEATDIAHDCIGATASLQQLADSIVEPWPLPNVWLGVSVENKAFKTRIDELRRTPAAVRFLSLEPLLEDIGRLHFEGLHWIIVGGESGPKARPFDLAWARSIVQQCRSSGVACFVKQVGAVPVVQCSQCGRTVGRVLGGAVDACGPTHAALIAETLRIRDTKGGEPSEWPSGDWPREFPR